MDDSSDECYSSSDDGSLSDYIQLGCKDADVYQRLAWIFDRDEDVESEYLRYITRFLAGITQL